ncbi:hypothetical protein SAMN05660742_1118 [Propionispira arboris]|uniref:Uncharacterized protein n=1 Tax=Propionispira arboris TaxID=84035 RepID=A0A1H7A8W3_9FIRM|nr:hypothetical protein [Propionispira arboris]SEJ58512.1 hypothetical protein SAMN05660742_1118 [Propionispira arboris]
MDTGIFLSQFRMSLFLELLPILFLGVFCGMFFCLTAKLQAEAVAAFVLPFTIHLPLAIAVGLVLAVYGGGRYGALLLGSMRARFDLSVAAASVASRFSHRETTEKIFLSVNWLHFLVLLRVLLFYFMAYQWWRNGI